MNTVAASLPFLLDRSPDGHLLVEADGTVAHANGAAQVLLGADAAAILGSPISRWIPQLEIRPGVSPPAFEADVVSATNDPFPAEVAIVGADDAAAGRSWVVFRDITARRGLEGSVRRHAEELESLVRSRTRDLDELRIRHLRLWDLAPVLDFELDSQGAIASANRKACLALGATFDHLVGVPLVDLAVPEKREELAVALNAFHEGSSVPYETRLRGRDGAVIDVQLHACRPEPTSRSGTRILGLDVTGLREAERQVDQSLDLAEAQRSRMERILRGIADGLVVTDPDGQVRLMNVVAERILAVDERFAFGRDLLAEQSDGEFVRRWKSFLNGDATTARADFTSPGAQGRRYAATFSRVKTAEGRLAACTAVLHDVTAQRRAELRAHEVVSDLAQELRANVMALRGRIGSPAPDVAPEIHRLGRIVEDLFLLSRLECGRETFNLQSHDLGEILREVCDREGSAAAARSVSCDVTVEVGSMRALIDASRTRRALDLLVARALRVTPAGRRVGVQLAHGAGRLVCTIADAGGASELEALRNPLDRSSATFRAGLAGAGFDLHLAQRLIELQGGEVAFETHGVGSTVRATFPVPQDVAPDSDRPGAGADPLVDEPDEEFLAEGSSARD
jgi:PAS domain S-box-containing protein